MNEPMHPLEWKLGADLWAELTAPSPDGPRAPNPPPAAKVRRMADWLWLHAPELIPAVRPKCERCKGRAYVEGDEWADGHSHLKKFIECPDCDATGWWVG